MQYQWRRIEAKESLSRVTWWQSLARSLRYWHSKKLNRGYWAYSQMGLEEDQFYGLKKLVENLASRYGKSVLQMYQGSEGYRVGSNGGENVGQELRKVLQKRLWFGIETGKQIKISSHCSGCCGQCPRFTDFRLVSAFWSLLKVLWLDLIIATVGVDMAGAKSILVNWN